MTKKTNYLSNISLNLNENVCVNQSEVLRQIYQHLKAIIILSGVLRYESIFPKGIITSYFVKMFFIF